MTASRYRNTLILSSSFYGTADFPESRALATIATFTIRTNAYDRLDTLAAKHLGSGEYWWVLAVLNQIEWAFDFVPGELMRIPIDVRDVLALF